MDAETDIRDPETFAIIGAAMAVHKGLGHGFLEAVYQEALNHEFTTRHIPAQKEVSLPIFYGETQLSTNYQTDFVCYGSIIIELKACSANLSGIEQAQVTNYLKASGYTKALLFNFGRPSLEYKRLIFSNHN